MNARKRTSRKAPTQTIVTVIPTINHDRMRRGHRYDLRMTDDVARRVEAGALTIVDRREEPVLEPASAAAPTPAPAPASTGSASDTLTAETAATEQDADDRHGNPDED